MYTCSFLVATVCILALFSLSNNKHFKAIADAQVDLTFPLPTTNNASLNLRILVSFS